MTVFADAAPTHDAVQENIREIDEDTEKISYMVANEVLYARSGFSTGKGDVQASHYLVLDPKSLGHVRDSADKTNTVQEIVDNPNLLLALEYQTLSFENAAVKVIHLKATTQYKDNVTKKKDGQSFISIKAAFDKSMLWNLNDATLHAIVNRFENDPEFYKAPQSVEVPQLVSKIKKAIKDELPEKEIFKGIAHWEESPLGKDKGGKPRNATTTLTYADPPRSKRVRELYEEIEAKDAELKRLKGIVSSCAVHESGEVHITLNLKNSKVLATEHTAIVVGTA